MNTQNKICLALDTAYQHGAISLFRDQEVIFEMVLAERFAHGRLVCEGLAEALLHCEKNGFHLDGVFCGLGPGSFVGVRIALATALGFCFGRRLPLMGFCSHEALAYSTNMRGTISLFMKASGDLGYYSRLHIGDDDEIVSELTKVISLAELSKTIELHGQIFTDQVDRIPKEIAAIEILGPTAAGIRKAVAARMRKIGSIVDEKSFIKPNYVKPPSVSVPKNLIVHR